MAAAPENKGCFSLTRTRGCIKKLRELRPPDAKMSEKRAEAVAPGESCNDFVRTNQDNCYNVERK